MLQALNLVLLSLSGAFSALELTAAPLHLPLFIVLASVAGLVLGARATASSYVVLGSSILLLPYFGFQALNLFLACFLLGAQLRMNRAPRSDIDYLRFGIFLILLVHIAGALVSFGAESDFGILLAIKELGGLGALLDFAKENFYRWHSVPLLLQGYVLSFCMVDALSRENRNEQFVEGLAIGALASALFLFVQMLSTNPYFHLNRSAFWSLTGRFAGFSSDPNAFGVMAALLVPVFFYASPRRWKNLFRVSALALCLAAPWSGSRTFWFALLVWAVALLCRSRHRQKLVATVFAFVCFLAAMAGSPEINVRLQESLPSPGIVRVLQTLNWEHGREMLLSREIYSRIAIEVWKKSPLIGVGLGEFYDRQESAAKRLGIEIGNWRDNANNFYLHILAEEGILGLALTLVGFSLIWLHARRVSLREEKLPRDLFCLAFYCLLITGPHLLFDEIKYVFFGALTVCSTRKELGSFSAQKLLRAWLLIPCLAFVYLLTLIPLSRDLRKGKGFYPEELGVDGPVRWTGAEAQFALCPVDTSETSISLKALNPDVTTNPLEVYLFLEDDRGSVSVQHLALGDHEWRVVPILLDGIWQAGRRLRIEMRLSRVWSPAKSGGSDPRALGVMLKRPSDLCSQEEE